MRTTGKTSSSHSKVCAKSWFIARVDGSGSSGVPPVVPPYELAASSALARSRASITSGQAAVTLSLLKLVGISGDTSETRDDTESARAQRERERNRKQPCQTFGTAVHTMCADDDAATIRRGAARPESCARAREKKLASCSFVKFCAIEV